VRPDVPVDPAGAAAPEGDTTQSRQAVSGLAVTAAGAGAVVQQGAAGATDEAAGGQQDASLDGAEVAEDAPADGAPGSEPAGRGAKPQAAGGTFGQALEGASRRRDAEGGPGDSNGGDGAAGDGGASAASWMEELESAAGEFAEALSPDGSAAAAPHASHATLDPSAARAAMDLAPGASGPAGARPAPAAPAPDPTPPEARFAAANHENIVKGMHAEVMPNGGTMRIRLDPPQLGALQVTVSVRDGVVTASFETSNDEATRLLGHSLNQLKAVLESRGVGVDKLQVQQAPRDEHANAPRDDGSRHRDQTPYEQEHAARQEQQRKEMLEKMWRRLSGAADPLDVTV
jgi:flagellar hook-length control protein FliK